MANTIIPGLQSWLVKLSGIAAAVAGILTTVNNDLPHAESGILTAVGAGVFLAERYWADVKKAL